MLLLTHWGRVTHTCVSKLTIIGSDNGLSPDRHQAIIWTNAGTLLIGPLETNFSETLIGILTFSFMKMRMKGSSVKRRPFCLGLSVLTASFHFVHLLLQHKIYRSENQVNQQYKKIIYWTLYRGINFCQMHNMPIYVILHDQCCIPQDTDNQNLEQAYVMKIVKLWHEVIHPPLNWHKEPW